MTINLQNLLRIYKDYNTHFIKLLSEIKKGHGSANIEMHDMGAPGSNSQGHLD
jgi:uncharacterized protein YbgA (DUF1722 family)